MSKNGMTRYIIKRVLYMFLVLFIIMTMCFILIKLLPLPAVREMGRDINLVLAKREKMGYNKPIMVQYFLYLKSILTEWDWGVGEQMYEGMGRVGCHDAEAALHGAGEPVFYPACDPAGSCFRHLCGAEEEQVAG